MVSGPTSSGKTFLVVDMLMCIATGRDWLGNKTKRKKVLYLCGEGGYDIKTRVKGWTMANPDAILEPGWLWILDEVFDFDKPEGYSYLVRQMELAGIKPDIVCFDTLNRFFAGDENKADESRQFVNNAEKLRIAYGCSTVVVHHTGVSNDAQGRSRGSSAWEGASDVVLCISVEGGTLSISQKKLKAGRNLKNPVHMAFHEVTLPHEWDDEDGESVTTSVLKWTPPPKPQTNDPLPEDVEAFRHALAELGMAGKDCIELSKRAWTDLMRKEGWEKIKIDNFFRMGKGPFTRLVGSGLASRDKDSIRTADEETIRWWLNNGRYAKKENLEKKEAHDDIPF